MAGHKQRGFTLIELVVVIVILGIIAAMALPKFVNLAADAQNAADNYTAGANTEHWSTVTACMAAAADKTKCN